MFTLDSPINELLANEQAAALLKSTLPMLTDNPMVSMLPISLRQVAAYANGAITSEILSELETKLQALG